MVRPFMYFEHFCYFFFWRLQKEMGNQKLFVQDTMKVIHNTRTTASIIKHSIIHIYMYLEEGMNVVFHHHLNAIFLTCFSFCTFFLCIARIPYQLFRELVSNEFY